MEWGGEWVVSELELIEPGLYLDVAPEIADRSPTWWPIGWRLTAMQCASIHSTSRVRWVDGTTNVRNVPDDVSARAEEERRGSWTVDGG